MNLRIRRLADELEQLTNTPQHIMQRRISEIEREINETISEMEKIRVAVEALPALQEQEVLKMRYMAGFSPDLTPWKEIAQKFYGKSGETEKKRILRLHREALEHLKLQGKKDSYDSSKEADCRVVGS